MSKLIKLKRGLDLKIKGEVRKGVPAIDVMPDTVAIFPEDFPGLTPKLCVKEGQQIECGSPIIFDKTDDRIKLVSPVTGTIKAIIRGERRKIIRVEIAVTGENTASGTASKVTPESLMANGLWALMRQRPYDVIPTPGITPVNIFVTGFDSAPLAPDLHEILRGQEQYIAAGAEALVGMTSGNVYVSTRPGVNLKLPAGVEQVTVVGPHPAGNAGVQCANICPVNKGDIVWTLDIVTLAKIGQLARTGHVDWSTEVAVTGPMVKEPKLVKTTVGAEINPLLNGNVISDQGNVRIISGNLLTGTAVGPDGFLHYPYRQVTVIAEGDDVDEFMGWASMSTDKLSTSRSFLSSLLKNKRFTPDARINGGRRAMIMSEQYDKVFPMDILPEYLVKAILAKDIEQMEKLGIYEVSPEDFALCEFVDPSKLELQKTVREGLDYLRKELE